MSVIYSARYYKIEMATADTVFFSGFAFRRSGEVKYEQASVT